MEKQQNRFERRPWLGWTMAFVLLVLASELGLRVFTPEAVRFAKDFREIYRYHDRWYTDFIPDTSTTIRLRDGHDGYYLNFLITANSLGFRWHDRLLDAPLPKAGERKIIHTIGDSFTMGWGVNYEASYPAQLHEQMGLEYTVINLGLNGYGAIGASEKSLQLMTELPPVAVVYLMTENDYADDQAAVVHARRSTPIHRLYDSWNFLRRHTYLASTPYALRWWLYFRPGQLANAQDATVQPSTNPGIVEASIPQTRPELGQASKLAITRYAAELSERGIPLLIIAHGRGNNAADFAGFSTASGINTSLLHLDDALLLRKEGHFNAAGNRALASYVAERLKGVLEAEETTED